MEDDRKLQELYQKVLNGTASPDEQALVARWLDRLQLNENLDRMTLDNWRKRSMNEFRKSVLNPSPTTPTRHWKRNYLQISVAAAVLLALAATAYLSRGVYSSADKPKQELAYTSHETTAGQRKLLTLADGSRVWLGNVSSVRYPKNFQTGKREVLLKGQAFFEIVPDATRPFLVRTDELDIRVLGTSFDVKSYPGDHEQTITVASGKVAVQPVQNKQQWIVESGQQVVYETATKSGGKRVADLAVMLAWKGGELVFKEQSLREIAIQLERWYGVEIEISSLSLGNKKLSLSVKDEPLEKVLNMLAMAGGFRIDMNGKHIKIVNKGSDSNEGRG